MKEKIYFIAKLPLPLGGVTVYNERKINELRKHYNVVHIDTSIFNFFNFFFVLIFSKKKVIVSSMNFLFIFLHVFSFNKHVSFIDHNASRGFYKKRWLEQKILEISFQKAESIVIVDEYLKLNYLGFSKINFVVQSAFLPPIESEISKICLKYPDVLNGLTQRKVVIASISKPYLNSEGKDVYSSELILDCFSHLSSLYKDLYFVVGISDDNQDSEYAKYIIRRAESLSDNNSNLLILKGGIELWPLFKKSLLYFRPTLTDGDSITLREAIYFGCKSLVSDIVPRPNEAILFNLENDDIIEKMKLILEDEDARY